MKQQFRELSESSETLPLVVVGTSWIIWIPAIFFGSGAVAAGHPHPKPQCSYVGALSTRAPPFGVWIEASGFVIRGLWVFLLGGSGFFIDGL